ncbi:hypothetical protein MGYG_06001 [Nannizzia gypsea CBS 118893]|uniref:DUF7357 domain-containing protein n=1 Tax=Arthroderma gypseum (strain ATCC MYA-4604 / CBS 118893) TaxID=535722 RepID=E4V064_ARTGP|nr:hypothetical protein MGYG_06001 [Nannizzia gypsea CBS 118893]EFR03001.1 hypothetical protein MGYG_06001 [Nannizzia gypsea CBS 118893]
MRLHLIIHRHELPVTRLLWSTPVTQSSGLSLSRQPSALSSFTSSGPASIRTLSASGSFNTAYTSACVPAAVGRDSNYIISQLLADVNEVVPLEAPVNIEDAAEDNGGQWQLHDYVVEIMGSECLHFMRVDALLREGDEVVIRPLDHEDMSARIATGRRQVAEDGTQLIDGVPFGNSRQELKRTTVSRPSITIPPRNKRRRLNGPDQGRGEITEPPSLLHESTVVIEDVISQTDDAAIPEEQQPAAEQDKTIVEVTEAVNVIVQDEEEDPNSAAGGVPVPEESVLITPPTVKRHKTTQPTLEQTVLPNPEEKNHSDDSSSKDSSEDEASSSSDDDSSDSDSDADSSSDSSPDSESDSNSGSSSNKSSGSDSSSSSSSSDSDSDSDSDLSSGPKLSSSKKKAVLPKPEQPKDKTTVAKAQVNPPGHGTVRTKHGNLRTKWRRRLIRLKVAGILHKDANFEDMRAWEKGNGGSEAVSALLEAKEKSEFERKREQLLRDIEEGGIEIPSPSGQKRKHKETSSAAEVDCLATSTPAKDKPSPFSDALASTRQSKLDLDSTRRLLFGSLGVKTPKTKEDEEKTRAKLAQKTSLTPKATPKVSERVTSQPPDEILQPIENWQDSITLKATECFYDGIELSTPPFPFLQRWDPDAHAAIQELRASQAPQGKKKKKNKRKRQSQSNGENENGYLAEFDESEIHPNEDITLDYGDETGGLNTDASVVAETQTKAKSQRDKIMPSPEKQSTTKHIAGDLPPLPKDISTLPDADNSNLLPGAIFAFKQLDLSKATNWQPEVSPYRTAIVENVKSADTITFRLAKRDRDVLDIDDADDGQPRSYTKFEMPGLDDIEEDDGLRELEIQNLIDPKLISAPAHVSVNKLQEQLAGAEEDLVGLIDRQLFEGPADESTNLASEVAETQNVRITEKAPPLTSSQPEDIQVSSPSRREISQLIRDAGFRSSVISELAVPGGEEVVEDSCPNMEEKRQDGTEETVCEQTHEDKTIVQESVTISQDIEKHDAEDPREDSLVVESPKFTGFDCDLSSKETAAEAPAEPDLRKFPSPPPLNSTVPETARPSPLSALENWISAQGSAQDSEKGKSPEPPDNEDETDEDDDSGDSHPNSLVPNPFYEIDNLSENDPTPSLEELLAESTPCPPASLKPPPATSKLARSSSPLPTAGPSVNSQHPAAKSTSPPPHEDDLPLQDAQDPPENNEPSASQIPDGSMVVDLTLSSDPVAGGDDDYVDECDDDFEEDSSLFHGPGWVAKRKPKAKAKAKAKPKPKPKSKGKGKGRGSASQGSQRGGRRPRLVLKRSTV